LNKKVFISKNSEEIELLQSSFLVDDIHFISHSFLTFEAIPFQISKPFDLVFISSIRSAAYFFKNFQPLSNQKIACFGKSTAQFVESMGYSVSFVGENGGNPLDVGEQLKEWAEGKKILFPVSNQSLQTISNLFPKKQKEIVVVYQTEINPKHIVACSIYIFTSPSNVEGFFIQNQLKENSIIIAWGNSTEKALSRFGFTCQHTLKTATFEELILLLKKLI
jgi:uroporphyrinogen-III synthase